MPSIRLHCTIRIRPLDRSPIRLNRGPISSAATIDAHFKRFCRNSCVRYRQPPMKRNFFWLAMLLMIVCTMFATQPSPSTSGGDFDVIIRNGTVYDGTGEEPRKADVAIRGDRIAGVGDFKSAKAKTVIDAMRLDVR